MLTMKDFKTWREGKEEEMVTHFHRLTQKIGPSGVVSYAVMLGMAGTLEDDSGSADTKPCPRPLVFVMKNVDRVFAAALKAPESASVTGGAGDV